MQRNKNPHRRAKETQISRGGNDADDHRGAKHPDHPEQLAQTDRHTFNKKAFGDPKLQTDACSESDPIHPSANDYGRR